MLTLNITRKGHGRMSGLSTVDTRTLLSAAVANRAIGRSSWFEFDGVYFVSESDVDAFALFAAKVLGNVKLMEPGQPTRTLNHPDPWGLGKVTPTIPAGNVPSWIWAPDVSAEKLLSQFSMAVAARILAARRLLASGGIDKGRAIAQVEEVLAR